MKILIVTNKANGLYQFRKELIQSLIRDGHQIAVSVPADKDINAIKELGCQVFDTAVDRRGKNPFRDIGLFFRYLILLKRERPEAVFTYTIKPNLYGGLACRICGIPYLVNITGVGSAIENGGLLSRLLLVFYRVSMKRALVVFFQNEGNQALMQQQGIGLHNGALLPGSGVNLTEHPFEEYPSENDGIRILTVIRIFREKGISEYLQAVETIFNRHPEVHFYLAGNYEKGMREQYEPTIKALTERGALTYLGNIDYVPRLMAESHIIVHPSYLEGISNVLLEAAACGRPVVACDIYGCKETFNEGVSGLSFKARNAQTLIDAIERMLAMTTEQRRQMGIAGRQWVEERFDRQIVINEYKHRVEQIERNRKN